MPLMLTICTSDAMVVSTTDNHLTWLGRDRDGVIGHRCSEWSTPEFWNLNWHMFQRSLSMGCALTWDRSVRRPDGSQDLGQVTVKPILTRTGRRMILCVNQVSLAGEAFSLRTDVQKGVAQVCGAIPQRTLLDSVEQIAADAASFAASLYETAVH